MAWGACLGAGLRIGSMADQAAGWDRAGIGHIWVGEVSGADAATAASVVASTTRSARVGMVWNVYLRSTALSAMTIGALADAAPGRVDVAFGVSSPLLVEQWHGVRFERPVERMVEMLQGVRAAFAGERLPGGFKLDLTPEVPPRLVLASTGPRMLREAGPLADAVVVNWCTVEDLARIPGLPGDPARVSGLVYVCPTDDRDEAHAAARRLLGGYLAAPGYASLQRLLGRGEALGPYWTLAGKGEWRAAAAAIPDEIVDTFVVHGSPATCRARLATWESAGFTPLVVTVGSPAYQARIDRMALDPLPDSW